MSQTKVVSKQELADLELAVYELLLKKEFHRHARAAHCGTASGYQAHYRRKEKPCEDCKEAARAYDRNYRLSKPKRPAVSCGTYSGYTTHHRRKEKPCLLCKSAAALYKLERRKNTEKSVRILKPCGTAAGFSRHTRKKEPACEECRLARSEHVRNRRALTRKAPASCGTTSGFYAHVRNKEDPCRYCNAAIKAYKRAWIVNLGKDPKRKEKYRVSAVVSDARKRARKRNAPSDKHTVADVLALYGTLCYICKEEIDLAAPRGIGKPGWEMGLHIEHLLPLSRGGSHTIGNVGPSHAWCNLSKGSKILDIALEELINRLLA